MISADKYKRIGIVGFGAVGQQVAVALQQEPCGLTLAAITSGNLDKARRRAAELLSKPPPVTTLAETAVLSDLVVEAAPAAAFDSIARTTLMAGKSLLVLSVGALLECEEAYKTLARKHGATIHVASGAIGGLDAITSASAGAVDAVRMITRKPPQGLSGAPYLVQNGIDVANLAKPQVVFEGTARQACQGFPANVNVSAAVSLAGIGPDQTQIQIIADPTIERNMHDVEITGEFGRFTTHIENIPTNNPRSGILTALSVIATLRKLASPLQVGT